MRFTTTTPADFTVTVTATDLAADQTAGRGYTAAQAWVYEFNLGDHDARIIGVPVNGHLVEEDVVMLALVQLDEDTRVVLMLSDPTGAEHIVSARPVIQGEEGLFLEVDNSGNLS